MSWKTKLGKLAVELGEDIVERAASVLGADATEAEVRTAARRIAAPKPAPKPKAALAHPPTARAPRPAASKPAARKPSTLSVARGTVRRRSLADVVAQPETREDLLSAVGAGRMPDLSVGYRKTYQADPGEDLAQEFLGVVDAPEVREATVPLANIPDLRALDTPGAVKTYPDYGDKFTAFGTSEVVPYAGAGHVMGSHADDAAREAYSMDPRRSWSDADGRDITIDALGGWQRPSLRATGVYKPPIEGAAVETNPVFVSRPLVGLPGGGGVDDASRGMMDLSGAVKGYIDAQGSSAWHKPLRGRSGPEAGSLFVPTEGATDADTLLQLRELAARNGMPDVVDTGQGVTVTNFMGAPAGKDTRKALKGGLDEEIASLLGSHPQQVGMDGGYTPLFELESEPGSGVVTDALLEMIDKYPESVRHRLDASEALRARARSGMEADAEGLFGPARPDIQNSRQAIADGGFTGLAAARKAGVALPSLAALMSLYGLEESPQASVDGGL